METDRFDRLATTLAASGTRRTLLSLLAALPLAGGLAARLAEMGEAAGRRKRRKARHRHRPGNDKQHRTGQRKGKRRCAKAGQTPQQGKRKQCCAGLSKDASGRCAAPAPPPPPPSCTGLQPTPTSATQGLQEAINAAASGATLTLCPGTWALKETVVIDKDLTLVGAGAGQTILDGGNAVKVLQIAAGSTVTLQDLSITKGRAVDGDIPDNHGGGIHNQGTLSLVGVSVTDNTAFHGGGIYNENATLTLQANSRVTDNTAANFGGGVYSVGLQGTLTLQANSRVTDNSARFGGGIYNSGGTMTLEAGSRVTGNTATIDGGGIYNSGGTVTVDPSALVCDNNPPASQCAGVPANCPNPANGTCPP